MKKKVMIGICVLLGMVLIIASLGRSERGTITEFVDNAVIVTSDDGKKVIRIENYHSYVPTGEQWSIEDKVEIKSGIFTGFSVRRLTE